MLRTNNTPRYIYYGPRRGRPQRAHRRALLETMLSPLSISLDDCCPGKLDPHTLFKPGTTEIWLEIGFGAGEHLAAQAKANPDVGFLGCEPFLNGVASLLSHIERESINNVRLFVGDGRLLLDALLTASISRAFLLFPDPWPKKRHHKRRLISSPTVSSLARILRSRAQLRFATDHPEYCRWTLVRFLSNPEYLWTAEQAADWYNRPTDGPPTRYEKKAIALGRVPIFLNFMRRHQQ